MINVLAVDDDPSFHELLKVKLSKTDFNLTLVLSEAEFYAKFNEEKYDVLLLDLSIDTNPLKGLEILAKIRQEDRGATVPVIVLSGASEKKIISSALELGANDFIIKPIDGGMLTTKIKLLVSGNKAFEKELEFGSSPGQKADVVIASKLRFVAINELGVIIEGNTFIAKGSKVKLRSDRIKEIYGVDTIEVYSTGFNSEVSGIYTTNCEIDPDQKELITKARAWIKAHVI